MSKINIVYWSMTGNTAEMASAIAEGINGAGKEAVITDVAGANMDELKNAAVFAMGCPSMGVEVLEEGEMEPFVTEVEQFVEGKTVALFGSYGWGDGEWMRNWTERMGEAGATVLNGEGLICQEMPNDEALAACRELGAQIAAV